MNNDNLTWLMNWYITQYDWVSKKGCWIEISTLDNPGWRLAISLEGTELEGKTLQKTIIDRTDDDWMHCFLRDGFFEGACGSLNLIETLEFFRHWVEESKESDLLKISTKRILPIAAEIPSVRLSSDNKIVLSGDGSKMRAGMNENNLMWLMQWRDKQCDGDWEHCFGIGINATDAPGWTIRIAVEETELEEIEFLPRKINRLLDDWLHCYIKEGYFYGRCSSQNLDEMLGIFREWAEAAQDPSNE